MRAGLSEDRREGPPPGAGRAQGGRREVIYRHAVLVRLTHWINALAIFLLIGSGLNIFNAHPRLYWGQAGDDYDPAILAIHAVGASPATARGVTEIGGLRFDTTGLLGWFPGAGRSANRAWPEWLTIPGPQDLADARHWHFFCAWVLVANALAYLAWSGLSGHLSRDIWPRLADLRQIPRSLWDHLRLKHPRGDDAKRYNVLQKLAYVGVLLLVCGMILTGLTLSPGFDAIAPWLLDLFGGRQSARTLHFIFASLIALFILVHLVEVVLAGPLNEVGSMITGRYRVPPEHD